MIQVNISDSDNNFSAANFIAMETRGHIFQKGKHDLEDKEIKAMDGTNFNKTVHKRLRSSLQTAAREAANQPPSTPQTDTDIDNLLPPLCWPHWRSSKNQGAQSTKSRLRSQYYGHCVEGKHVEPWAAGLAEPPKWVNRPNAANKIIKIRREAALAVSMVGHETLLEMEAEYLAGSESFLDVIYGTVDRIDGSHEADIKMTKVKKYVASKIHEEYEEQQVVLQTRMSLLNTKALTDAELLNPYKAYREINKKAVPPSKPPPRGPKGWQSKRKRQQKPRCQP